MFTKVGQASSLKLVRWLVGSRGHAFPPCAGRAGGEAPCGGHTSFSLDNGDGRSCAWKEADS